MSHTFGQYHGRHRRKPYSRHCLWHCCRFLPSAEVPFVLFSTYNANSLVFRFRNTLRSVPNESVSYAQQKKIILYLYIYIYSPSYILCEPLVPRSCAGNWISVVLRTYSYTPQGTFRHGRAINIWWADFCARSVFRYAYIYRHIHVLIYIYIMQVCATGRV